MFPPALWKVPEFYPECENFGNGYLKMKATQFEPFTEVHVNNRRRLERIFTRVFASKERICNNCGKNYGEQTKDTKQ